MKWLRKILINIQRRARRKGFATAIELARTISDRTGKTCLIFFLNGQYEVYEKQHLTSLRNAHRAFRGMSNEEIENMAELKIYKQMQIPMAKAAKPEEKPIKLTTEEIQKMKDDKQKLVKNHTTVRK